MVTVQYFSCNMIKIEMCQKQNQNFKILHHNFFLDKLLLNNFVIPNHSGRHLGPWKQLPCKVVVKFPQPTRRQSTHRQCCSRFRHRKIVQKIHKSLHKRPLFFYDLVVASRVGISFAAQSANSSHKSVSAGPAWNLPPIISWRTTCEVTVISLSFLNPNKVVKSGRFECYSTTNY